MESIWNQHRFVSGRYGIDIDWYKADTQSIFCQIHLNVVDVGSIYVDIGLMLNRYGINIHAYRVSMELIQIDIALIWNRCGINIDLYRVDTGPI